MRAECGFRPTHTNHAWPGRAQHSPSRPNKRGDESSTIESSSILASEFHLFNREDDELSSHESVAMHGRHAPDRSDVADESPSGLLLRRQRFHLQPTPADIIGKTFGTAESGGSRRFLPSGRREDQNVAMTLQSLEPMPNPQREPSVANCLTPQLPFLSASVGLREAGNRSTGGSPTPNVEQENRNGEQHMPRPAGTASSMASSSHQASNAVRELMVRHIGSNQAENSRGQAAAASPNDLDRLTQSRSEDRLPSVPLAEEDTHTARRQHMGSVHSQSGQLAAVESATPKRDWGDDSLGYSESADPIKRVSNEERFDGSSGSDGGESRQEDSGGCSDGGGSGRAELNEAEAQMLAEVISRVRRGVRRAGGLRSWLHSGSQDVASCPRSTGQVSHGCAPTDDGANMSNAEKRTEASVDVGLRNGYLLVERLETEMEARDVLCADPILTEAVVALSARGRQALPHLAARARAEIENLRLSGGVLHRRSGIIVVSGRERASIACARGIKELAAGTAPIIVTARLRDPGLGDRAFSSPSPHLYARIRHHPILTRNKHHEIAGYLEGLAASNLRTHSTAPSPPGATPPEAVVAVAQRAAELLRVLETRYRGEVHSHWRTWFGGACH